ncbi:hypothetical protein QCA50_005334 [Cerrena zonata]|uniref:F-box domain-containing protein n=1 Tax=Cerrena zonata TaxID=2478898 RepID=A0AAW0GQU3_9APHY
MMVVLRSTIKRATHGATRQDHLLTLTFNHHIPTSMLPIPVNRKDEQARREIENEIDQLFQAVVELRHRLNFLVPINHLPPELLLEIFLFFEDGSGRSSGIKSKLTWIAVCRYWREIALETPRFWATVNLDRHVFARNRCMVLARPLPLRLLASRWCLDQNILFDTMISNMEPINSIDFDFPHRSYPSYAKLDTIRPAILPLRSVRIANNNDLLEDFPSILKKCTLPAIQDLELTGSISKLPPCLLGPTLIHLKLLMPSLFTDPVQFTRCLSQMSQLESLHIQEVSFRKGPIDQVPIKLKKKVTLPSLRQLCLKPPSGETEEDYILLLGTLEMPIVARLHLKFASVPVQHLPELLRVMLRALRHLTFRSLSLCAANSAFKIGLFKNTRHPSTMDSMDCTPPIDIRLPNSSRCQRIMWDSFLHIIHLDRIQTIHLEDLDADKKFTDDRRRLLRTCHHLKVLSVVGETGPEVINLLHGAELTNMVDGDTVSQMIVPELKTIHLTGVTWRSRQHEETVTDDSERGELVTDLVRVLQARRTAGCPIKKVVIKWGILLYITDVDLIQEEGVVVERDDYIVDPNNEDAYLNYEGGYEY